MLEQLRGQGFVRARIDGDRARARRRRRSSIRRRSTRSKRSSTASSARRRRPAPRGIVRDRAAARGRRRARRRSWTSRSSDELVFSDKFACPICGYSVAELEPRLFSFNNPAGACPTCDGLGVQQFFDPARVVHHPHLSLAGGAIRGWDRRNAYYFAADAVARAALQVRRRGAVAGPVAEASARWCCTAAATTRSSSATSTRAAARMRRSAQFEGIMPEPRAPLPRNRIARRCARSSRSTSSMQPCPDCGGTRLNRAARNVFVAERTLPRDRAARGRRRAELFSDAEARRLARRDRREDRQGNRASACGSSSTSASTTSRSIAAPTRSRAAKRSASGSRARSAPGSSASCTSSTSRRSACTSATTSGCCAR